MNDLEVRGYRWRHLFAFALMFAFVQQLHYLLRRGHFEPEGLLPVASACVLLGLFGSSERYHLRVVDGVLSGPARHGRRRVQFAVTEIDHARSAKPHFFGGRTVWSRSGDAIYIDPVTVPRQGRLRLLRALGLS